MCNLYAMTRSADEMRRLFADLSPIDLLGNLPDRTHGMAGQIEYVAS